MRRDSSFCLCCFLGLVFLMLSSLFNAYAAPTKEKTKDKMEITGKKIKEPKKNGKDGREFPTMFDIAARARKAKDMKEGKTK